MVIVPNRRIRLWLLFSLSRRLRPLGMPGVALLFPPTARGARRGLRRPRSCVYVRGYRATRPGNGPVLSPPRGPAGGGHRSQSCAAALFCPCRKCSDAAWRHPYSLYLSPYRRRRYRPSSWQCISFPFWACLWVFGSAISFLSIPSGLREFLGLFLLGALLRRRGDGLAV
jgi:hypothetical protein